MTRVKFTKKTSPGTVVSVFDQDSKKTYFHDHNNTPDFMDTKKFNEEYQQAEQWKPLR